MAVRKILLCWLRELVAVRAVFKTLRGDRACKALSLGEVAAAVRLRKAGCVFVNILRISCRRPPLVAATLSAFTVSRQRWDCDIPTVTLALPLATFDQSVFLSPYPYYNFKSAFWPVLQKTIEINRLTLSSPLLRPDLGDLAKPDAKNGQDFRLAQSAQAISSSLFNLNTSQMSLIRS